MRRHDLDVRARPGRSAPQDAGQISPSSRAFAPIAAGSTPATGAIEPSRPSSPSTVKPDNASGGIAPIAAIRPSANGEIKFGRLLSRGGWAGGRGGLQWGGG